MSGQITTTIDNHLGIVRITGQGVWTTESIDSHFKDLGSHADMFRHRGEDMLVLIDLTEAGVQPTATVERLKTGTQNFYRPGDRVAMIVASCHAKTQLRATLDTSLHEVFVSRNAAMTWLLAYSRPRDMSKAV